MKLFSDAVSARLLMQQKVISAKFILNFKKISRKMEDDAEISRALSAMFTPLADDSSVKVKLKNGKTMKAGEMLKSKEIDVDTLESGAINEAAVEDDMEQFLKELKSYVR